MKRSSTYLFHVLLVASDVLTGTWSIEEVREPSMRLHDCGKSFAEEKESLLAYLACDDYFPREGFVTVESGMPCCASDSNRTVSFYGQDYEPESEDIRGPHVASNFTAELLALFKTEAEVKGRIEQQKIPEVYTAEQWQAMVHEASRYENHYRRLTPRGHNRGRVPAEMHDADEGEDAYYEGEGYIPGGASYYGYYEAPMHDNYHDRDHPIDAGVHYTCL